jgi:hypothetical protein
LILDVVKATMEISADAINDHIPIRLRNPEMQAELQPLDVDPQQANDGESDVV